MEIWKNLSLEDMEGEVWKDIEGYEGIYQVSNMGRVKSLDRTIKRINNRSDYAKMKGRVLAQFKDTKGYLTTNLCKDGKQSHPPIHRLVAKAFVDNIENKKTVDHINTIITDNRAENLRWFTYKEQVTLNEITRERHKKVVIENGRKSIKIAHERNKRKTRCITTGMIFDSAKEAGEFYGINPRNISDYCRTKRKARNGMEWEYID